MNILRITLIFFTLTILLSFKNQTLPEGVSINPILGDISFIQKFGCIPDTKTDENLRIKTHLDYVEKLLRQKDVSKLSSDLVQKRNHLLDLLHEYSEAGSYPKNFDYQDHRQPCFIDKEGRICAVGFLIEKTTNRHTAELINKNHKYEKIFEMNDSSVDSWISESGLTKEECAMIQPTYGPPPVYTNNYISPSYGISSSVLSGINISLTTINSIQISKGTKNITVPVLGLIAGAGQAALGIIKFPEDDWSGGSMYATTNESQKTLSLINIGVGTTTIFLSTWNLIANRTPKTKLTSWSIFGIPTKDNSVALSFSFSRMF